MIKSLKQTISILKMKTWPSTYIITHSWLVSHRLRSNSHLSWDKCQVQSNWDTRVTWQIINDSLWSCDGTCSCVGSPLVLSLHSATKPSQRQSGKGTINLVLQRRKSKQAHIYLAKAAQDKGLSQDTNPGLCFQSLCCAIPLGKLGPDGSCSKEST